MRCCVAPTRFQTRSLRQDQTVTVLSWKVAGCWAAYRMLPTIVGTPILTSGKEKVASSEAMMKSHVAAAVSPAHRARGTVGQARLGRLGTGRQLPSSVGGRQTSDQQP